MGKAGVHDRSEGGAIAEAHTADDGVREGAGRGPVLAGGSEQQWFGGRRPEPRSRSTCALRSHAEGVARRATCAWKRGCFFYTELERMPSSREHSRVVLLGIRVA